ncbi:MAG: InlB B-repeat-containing protein [Spirochaetia bacterium]|nr:InlB B-repeat-containing protein [Spirochaetia bacterium]
MRLRPAISILLITSLILFATSCGGGGGGGAGEGFTVNYDVNGAESGAGPEGQFSSGEEVVIRENTGNLAKAGYLFDGWNTKADGTGKNYAPGAKYKGDDLVLYPKWAAIYEVLLMSGGSPSPSLYGVPALPSGYFLQITGLTARGRQLSSLDIPSAIDGKPMNIIGDNAFQGCTNLTDVTVPASVLWIMAGAFDGCTNLTSIVMRSEIPREVDPAFLGSCPATVYVPIAAVAAYQAAEGWNANPGIIAGYTDEPHTVTFDSQGATTPASPASMTVNPPSVIVGTLPTPPQKTGYNFGGWFTGTGGTGTEFTATTPFTINLTVYAYWEEYSYTVAFDDQGATTPVSPDSKAVNSPATTIDALPTAPAKNGQIFAGWYTQTGGGGTQFTASTPVTGNITVYAYWVDYSYTVTFDDQDATTHVTPSTKTVNSPATTVGSLPTPPEKTNFAFGGWYTQAGGGGTEFTAETAVTGDITVYAKWNLVYTVTFNDQGATTPVSPATKTVVSPATTVGSLPTAPEKTCFTFGGWYTQPGGAGDAFTAGTTVTGNITVYAKWTLNNMVNIPGKTFKMLSTEVTQALYTAIMGENPSLYVGDTLPVLDVGWFEALAFCNALSTFTGLEPVYTINGNDVTQDTSKSGFRLPTVEEWRYAASGGEAYTYAGSDTIDDVAWYKENTYSLQVVGQKNPNGYGLYDMSGNVWEWCWDVYYSGGPTWRYLCGGSFGSPASWCAITYENGYHYDGNFYGFRIVCKQ